MDKSSTLDEKTTSKTIIFNIEESILSRRNSETLK